MKSAVFFDIDGTLWNYDHYIPESEYEAIRRLRENGHMAFICSGRARAFINDPELLALGFDGIVCSCGCHIELGGQVAYENIIDKDQAIRTIELVRRYGFRPILEGPEHLYMDDSEFGLDDPFGNLLRRDMGSGLLTIGGDNYGSWHINKMSCATEVPAEAKEECYSLLAPNYEIIIHNENVCELVPKGFNKAKGMLHACQLAGIDPANTYAFGDSENDIEMLQTAAHSVAMGNGTDHAKSVAEYVTAPFDEDGILKGLEHYGLI